VNENFQLNVRGEIRKKETRGQGGNIF